MTSRIAQVGATSCGGAMASECLESMVIGCKPMQSEAVEDASVSRNVFLASGHRRLELCGIESAGEAKRAA